MHILVSKRGLINLVETVLDDKDLTGVEPCIIQIEDRESSYEFLLLRQNDICQVYEQVYCLFARPLSPVHYDWAELGLLYKNQYSTTIVTGWNAQDLTPNVLRAELFLDPADLAEDVAVERGSLDPIVCIGDTCLSSYNEYSKRQMSWSCTGYDTTGHD